jgi:hypothetical protein
LLQGTDRYHCEHCVGQRHHVDRARAIEQRCRFAERLVRAQEAKHFFLASAARQRELGEAIGDGDDARQRFALPCNQRAGAAVLDPRLGRDQFDAGTVDIAEHRHACDHALEQSLIARRAARTVDGCHTPLSVAVRQLCCADTGRI